MAERNLKGDVNVEFTEALSRQGLDSGESVKNLFGKLRKWLSDLKPVAFSGSYSDLSNKPTIPDISGKADKSTTVSTVTYDATNKKLTKTINNVTSDIASLSKFKEDMELNNIVTIPTIPSKQLPSQSTSNEIYFKEWLVYCIENYREIMLSMKTIVGVCTPNVRGSVIGQCYNAGVDSTTGLPRYCCFAYIMLNGAIFTFGTNDYIFFFRNIDTWRGIQNSLTSSSTSESLAAAQGKVLKELADTIQAQANYNTNQGVKNLFRITAESQTINGVTFTVDKVAGTVTANGTATAALWFTLYAVSLPAGKYTLSGCPSTGSWETYSLVLYEDVTGAAPDIAIDTGEGNTFSVGAKKARLQIRIIEGITLGNVVFKPMIRDASIKDNTFEPYAEPNHQLTQKVEDISDCLYIEAYNAGTAITIQNTSDFTLNLFNKFSAIDAEPRFAFLKLSSSGTTYYLRAMINVKFASPGATIDVSFIANGTTLYNFGWYMQSGTLSTPTITAKTLE